MNKKEIVGALISILLLLLSLGVIGNPFFDKTADFSIDQISTQNLSYGTIKPSFVNITLTNLRSEAIDVNFVISYNNTILVSAPLHEDQPLKQETSFGIIVPQHLFAGETKDLELAFLQRSKDPTNYQIVNFYLCPLGYCNDTTNFEEYYSKKSIEFYTSSEPSGLTFPLSG